MPKVYVSYRFLEIDAHYKSAIDNWPRQADIKEISFDSLDDHNYTGYEDKEIKREIRKKMIDCEMLLVVVGDASYNSRWIDYEIDVAISSNKRRFWTQVPGTNGMAPEKIIKQREVEFKLSAIKHEIREYQKLNDKENAKTKKI